MLLTLENIFVSDFIKENETTRSGKHELKDRKDLNKNLFCLVKKDKRI